MRGSRQRDTQAGLVHIIEDRHLGSLGHCLYQLQDFLPGHQSSPASLWRLK